MLKTLLGLQEIDRDIFRVKSELERLPRERAKREEALQRQEAELEARLQRGRELRARVKELEDLTTINRQRIRKLENESNSSRQDMALIAAYQHEIRTRRRESKGADDEALELMEQLETIDADVEQRRAALEEERAVFAELCANVERETAAAREELAALAARRSQRTGDELPPATVELYGRLLEAREGEALAPLDGRSCQMCFMEIPTNLCVRLARGAELVQCPSCDRILYPVGLSAGS